MFSSYKNLPPTLLHFCVLGSHDDSSPVTEATDGGLKVLVELMEKCSCLEEVPGC